MRETPDIETSSSAYAARFSGAAGKFLLDTQAVAVESLLSGIAPTSVLDVGGGHGQLLDLYSRLAMDVTIHGSGAECFENLGPPSPNTQFFISDIYALPFRSQSFDVVVAVRLISHLENWPAALAEMCRVARSCVIVDYPSKHSLNALTPLLFKLKRSIEKNTREYTSFTRGQLEDVFGPLGFPRVTEYKQFFLPMVIHRVLAGRSIAGLAERAFRMIHFTDMFGSPVMLKAEREPSSSRVSGEHK